MYFNNKAQTYHMDILLNNTYENKIINKNLCNLYFLFKIYFIICFF